MNIERMYITEYLQENKISPKTQGYHVLEEAIYHSLHHPDEPAFQIFSAVAEHMKKHSWRAAYRLAYYSLAKSYEEPATTGTDTLCSFIRCGVVAVNSRLSFNDLHKTKEMEASHI